MRPRSALPAAAVARDGERRRAWLGGFNLLPYREREARRARRRAAFEFAGALGLGAACATLVSLAGLAERTRLDAQRSAIEARLAGWAPRVRDIQAAARASDARRARARAASEAARPLARLVALLDVLRALDYRAVMLLALRQAGEHAELDIRAGDPVAASRWLARLRERQPGWRVEVSAVDRAEVAAGKVAAGGQAGPGAKGVAAAGSLRFMVRIHWAEPAVRAEVAAGRGGRG